MEKATPILDVQKLTKAFGDFQAVRDANFTVNKGEIFGFLGPNGAGKSTTIRVILDILRPTEGQVVLFNDPSLSAYGAHRRIGYLSGDMVLDNDLTGAQYVGLVSALHGGGHEKRITELADTLQADLTKKIGSYSRGNRQKIGLIAALLHEPELLILDEPSSGFDPLVQETFMQLVREYRERGGTVFMSSHILSEVQQLCDRIAFIKDGEIISVQSLNELEAETAKRIHVLWTSGTKPPAVSLKGLKEVRHDQRGAVYSYEGDMTSLLTAFSKLPVKDITIQEPDLEELFITYYKDKK
jgi:ABC-2 type transport system ATP-binding protein